MDSSRTREYVGFTPYSYQRDVIDRVKDAHRTGKRVVVKSSRQKGKSYMVANILLMYAINHTSTRNFYIAPTLKQAKEMFSLIVDATSGTGVLKSSNATELQIFIGDSSRITFKSAEQKDALRGFTCSGILCIDEAAFIPDEVYYLIAPWTDACKAVTLMISTPFTKSGFFWNFYNYGLEGTNNTETLDWNDPKYARDMEKVLPKERLEEYRRIFPKNQFRTEYMGEWLDDDSTVFAGFTNCIKSETYSWSALYVGIDWGLGGGDSTVISAFNEKGNQVFLEKRNDLSPTSQIEWIKGWIKERKTRIKRVVAESNSLGTVYIDTLKQALSKENINVSITDFNTSNSSKNTLVTDMQIAIEKGDVTFMDDPFQKIEMNAFSANYNLKTKTISYSAPNGLHDDIVMADLMAWNGLSRVSSGRYSISIR